MCRSLCLIHDPATAYAHNHTAAGGERLQGVFLGAFVGILTGVDGQLVGYSRFLQALCGFALGGVPGTGACDDQSLFAETGNLAAQQGQCAGFLNIAACAEFVSGVQLDISQTSCFCHMLLLNPYRRPSWR